MHLKRPNTALGRASLSTYFRYGGVTTKIRFTSLFQTRPIKRAAISGRAEHSEARLVFGITACHVPL